MIYTLIGRLVVKGAKVFLRRRYGATHTPKPLLAGVAAVAMAAVAAVAAAKRSDS